MRIPAAAMRSKSGSPARWMFTPKLLPTTSGGKSPRCGGAAKADVVQAIAKETTDQSSAGRLSSRRLTMRDTRRRWRTSVGPKRRRRIRNQRGRPGVGGVDDHAIAGVRMNELVDVGHCRRAIGAAHPDDRKDDVDQRGKAEGVAKRGKRWGLHYDDIVV